MVRTLGVIGGMGPQATVDFFQKVLDNTKAHSDQEHIHMLIDNNPKTPDRNAAVLGKGESPLKALVNSAIKLQTMGAELLAMPCNTAHYFYDDIIKFIDIPFINMIEEAVAIIRTKNTGVKKVGLLATKAVCDMGLYSRCLKKYDINPILPDARGRDVVTETIYSIKRDIRLVRTEDINDIIKDMRVKGVNIIILGCTELPMIIDKYPEGIEYIDTTGILAKRAVELAKTYAETTCNANSARGTL